MSYDWNNTNFYHEQSVADIPCIMGASYASNKEYWNRIHGLNGLRSYGCDEQLISMKTILEGGSCKIIKNIVFGHIFRILKEVPYKIDSVDYIFNQLYIIELFYPREDKINFFGGLKINVKKVSLVKLLKRLLKFKMIFIKRKNIMKICLQKILNIY